MDNKDLNNNLGTNETPNAQPSINQDNSVEPKEVNTTNKEEVTIPDSVINIPESNENKEEVKAQNQTLNPAADFSAIFSVASEEQAPEPKMEMPKVNEVPAPEEKVEAPEVPETKEETKPKFNVDQFNSEEKVLYEIKPEKEGNPIVVVFFFLFLIGFILFLPSIVKVADFSFTSSGKSKTPEQESQSEVFELESTSVRVKIDNLELSNFVTSNELDEHYLIFTLTNTKGQPYMYDKKFYVTLLEEDKVVGYALIHSYDIVPAYGASEVKVVISERAYNRANKLKVEEIQQARYPNVSTMETDGDYDVLTCNHLNDEMKYYFINDSLMKIKETYKEEQVNSKNYTANKDSYRALSEQYKQIENFTSNFVETGTDFTMINDIELKDIPDKTLSDLKVYRYFRYSENINTVAFEIEAQGYTCK